MVWELIANGIDASVGFPSVAIPCLSLVFQYRFGGAQSPLRWEDGTVAGPSRLMVIYKLLSLKLVS